MVAQPARKSADTNGYGLSDQHKHLVFMLADKRFAVPIASIQRILEHEEPKYVPMLPPDCPGIIHLDEVSIPLFDLQSRFGLGKTRRLPRSGILIVEFGTALDRLRVGILVDAVLHVSGIPDEDITPVPDFSGNRDMRIARGISRTENAVILDPEQLVSKQDRECLKTFE